jgi:flagellar protein FliT
MTAQDALAQYGEIQRVTQDMLAAAQAGDWEALVNLEAGRKAALASLMAEEIDYRAAGLGAEKDACIQSILDMDRRIATLTEAWMGEMREMLAAVQSQRKLEKAYGTT